jgi:hypothetical protein
MNIFSVFNILIFNKSNQSFKKYFNNTIHNFFE